MNQLCPTKQELLGALVDVGVERGDCLYVASSLAGLGAMEDPVQAVLGALQQAVGEGGMIVMPTFNFSFCDGEPFDREKTPSTVGVLTETFRKMPGVARSWAPPFHSVAVWGSQAERVTTIQSLTSFGRDSVFQHLHDIDAKHLLIGCGYHDGVAHFHWLEELYEVPYRYWKKFEGEIVLNSQTQQRAFFMYARHRRACVQADALGEQFENAGFVRQTSVGLCRIRAFCLKDFKRFFGPRFEANPCAMLVSDQTAHSGMAPSPVRRIDHIAIVSKYADRIRELLAVLPCHLEFEGEVRELGVNCQYYGGLNVKIEVVDPTRPGSAVDNYLNRYPNSPLHHIAFEVSSFEDALPYFEARGYQLLDGCFYLGPSPYQRVTFLSPVQSGGLLVELVVHDGGEYRVYGGEK